MPRPTSAHRACPVGGSSLKPKPCTHKGDDKQSQHPQDAQGTRQKPKSQKTTFPHYLRTRKRKTPRTLWQTTCHSCPQKGTGGNMLFDPTESDVNPCLIRTRIRTMTELILALTIHDKDVTMAKPARVTVVAWTGLTLPFEERQVPKLTETMSFASPRSPNSGSSSLCHPTCEDLPR